MGNARFLLLAGDIGNISKDAAKYEKFILRLSKQYDHIFLIAGNNEWKSKGTNMDMDAILTRFKKLEDYVLAGTGEPKLSVLEEETYDMESRYNIPITVLGCTMWTRIREGGGVAMAIKLSIMTIDDIRLVSKSLWRG